MKSNHPNNIRICNKFLQNACRFQTCWYLHEEAMETDDDKEETNEEEEIVNTESVFQKAFVSRKPPLNKQKKQKTD